MNIPLPPSPLSQTQQRQFDDFVRTLDGQQLDWIQGYLAGYRAGQSSDTAPAQSESAPVFTVLYGSQTGNAEALAQTLADRAGERGLAVECLDMNDFAGRRLKKTERLAIITSTHGEGDPPDNALSLYEFLHSRKAPKLGHLHYSVLALGDSSYEHFCQTGVDFDERLAALGGERLTERVDCDVDYDEPAEQWMARVLDALAELSPSAERRPAAASVPKASTGYDRKHPFAAPMLDRVGLNGRGSSKSVYHLELSLEGSGLTYKPGDSLGVYAQNDPRLVSRLIETLGLDRQTTVTVKEGSVTLDKALHHHRELTRLTPPTVKRWAALTESTQLEQLTGQRRALIDWLHGRDILDLVEDYPVADLEAQALVDALRPLPPRLYSIASSQQAVDDEVHLTVAAVRHHQRGREREGVASTWLADRQSLDDSAPVFIDHNKGFHLPDDPDTPIIMVGPGTGIAPFRAFMQEREVLGHSGQNWLFFGDRHFRTDFLYQSEWLAWRRQGLLTRLDVAFSRDTQEKVYVQHRLREAGADVWQWLNEGATFYVCGDAHAMAPDVHEALLDIVARHGQKTREEAEQYLRELSRDKRYQRDVY